MTAACILSAMTGTSLVGFVLAQAAGGEPWWIAAIVVPLAGFSAWLVRWILQKQDERDKAIAARETKREEREEKRAEHAELQTRALQECVAELRTMNSQQAAHGKALADNGRAIASLPDRVAERIGNQPPRVST